MSFTGVELWLFLPTLLLLYWALPRRAILQNLTLLAASYFFYYSWNPRLLPLLVLATAVDWSLGLVIERARAAAYPDGEDRPARRRPLALMRGALALSVLYNLGQLCYFKYWNFFAGSLNDLLHGVGFGGSLPFLHVALPLGISFYTVQKLGYILDVYHGRAPACRSPLTFATFVAFFPQLIAGPIPRAADLLPQLGAARRLAASHFAEGAGIFLVGFVKKAYVADLLGQILVDPVFANPENYSIVGHWLGLAGFAVQIFCDFSGYSEMAIGCGRLFGIELPRNFNYPFFARNLIDLWRRWHITLNTWLFEYLYGPMITGTGWLRGRLDLGFLIVFFLSGLWHGARATFLVWGILHGIGLVVSRRWDERWRALCRKDRKYVAIRKSPRYLAAAWAATQLFFVLTLVPFHTATLAEAGEFTRGLLVPHGGWTLPQENVPYLRTVNLLCAFGLFIAYHLLELPRGRVWRERFFALPPLARGAVYGLVVVFLFLFVPVAGGTFIYRQF